jgi:hypothetical protein
MLALYLKQPIWWAGFDDYGEYFRAFEAKSVDPKRTTRYDHRSILDHSKTDPRLDKQSSHQDADDIRDRWKSIIIGPGVRPSREHSGASSRRDFAHSPRS